MKNGCPNQASKQLKTNGQMERMMKMTMKDQGERGMEKNPLLPPDRKPYPYNKKINQVVSTSAAPRGYSHHPHIEKERNNSRSKREGKERKNKLNSRSVYQELH